ncbi:MAG: hypothetical protein LBP21_08725 [Synergistaceae bacterium]|jgi:hypothetical protein|nr:hypothetical protein [Synergistaceae bacterium]
MTVPMDLMDLLKGEALMTVNIVFGLFVGELVFRLRVAEAFMKRFLPSMKALGPLLATALVISIGSSKAAATLLARGMEEEKLSRNGAVWGTLSLSFPAYLRRWPSTLALCGSMAGTGGIVFALALLLRSLGRFCFVLFIFKARGSEQDFTALDAQDPGKVNPSFWLKRLAATLPVAWIFYAAAFSIMPGLERLLKENLGGSILPAAGWGVASAALAGISASLALARGAIDAGELTTAQVVFALLLGNGMGYFTRALRQNAGYFFGIFPADISRSIFLWNMATMLPFVAFSLAVSAFFLF